MTELVIIKLVLAVPWLVALSIKDCKTHELPNSWVGGGALVALAVSLAYGLNYTLAALLTAFFSSLFLLLPFFLRAAGAGDVKMLFAAGLIAGPGNTLNLLLLVSVAGLLLAAVMIVLHRVDLSRLKHYAHCLFDFRYDRQQGKANLPELSCEACRIPFGIAISAGLVVNLVLQLIYCW